MPAMTFSVRSYWKRARNDSAHGETELESQRDVDQDACKREDRGQRALPLQLVADDGADDLRALEREVADVRLADRVHDGVRRAAQLARHLGAHFADADHDFVTVRLSVPLDDRVVAARKARRQGRSNGRDIGLRVELQDDDRAALEFDAERKAARQNRTEPDRYDHERQDDGVPTPAYEVEIGILENLHDGPRCSGSARPGR
jgi:hypothetical protein